MKLSSDAVAFLQMTQVALTNIATKYLSCFDNTTEKQLAEAKIAGMIVGETELFFEERGLVQREKVGCIEFRGFTLKGQLMNGNSFESYGFVGRKHGKERWCSLGVSIKITDHELEESLASGAFIVGGNPNDDHHTFLSYCDEEVPFRLCQMANEKRRDFVQWLLECEN